MFLSCTFLSALILFLPPCVILWWNFWCREAQYLQEASSIIVEIVSYFLQTLFDMMQNSCSEVITNYITSNIMLHSWYVGLFLRIHLCSAPNMSTAALATYLFTRSADLWQPAIHTSRVQYEAIF